MKPIVIYTSKYGSTEQYAQWLAESLACPMKKMADISTQELASYDTIIYGGGIYAGNIAGFKKFAAKLETLQDKKVIVFMVGMTNPNEKEFYAEVAANALPAEWQDQVKAFALQGDLLYTKMRWLHKQMMKMMKSAAVKKAVAERTADDQKIIENFGSDILFASRKQLAPLLANL